MNRIPEGKINQLLCNIQNPARFVGGELNQVIKQNPFLRMAVCYPDLYEIGMSNEGIRILYDIANRKEQVFCERVFAVPPELEGKMKISGLPLYTLETFTPIGRMDLIGFNLSHELLHTGVLQVLDLGSIPLLSKDRGEDDPIVIAGGEAVSNPLPVSDFFDAFYIGDGEEGILDIIDTLITAKKNHLRRKEMILEMSRVEGIFVPSMYNFINDNEKPVIVRGKVVRKRIYRGGVPASPDKPLIPNVRITHERIVVEVTRGCRNLCKFCHAGYYELPYRRYSAGDVEKKVLELIDSTGYNEISFSSLSLSDYRYLVELLNRLMPVLNERGISLSLPSLRVDKNTINIIEHLSDIRKSTLTFAVESASDDIRNISNKKLLRQDLLDIVQYVFKQGWRSIKLYFMLGLPGSKTHDEADEIIKLLNEIYKTARSIVKKCSINVTLSPFVPKPHTPFQREEQRDTEYFLKAIQRIKSSLPRAIAIKNHDVRASFLEGLFSRGDNRLGKLVLNSYKQGARLDSWKEHFRFDIWENSLRDIPGLSNSFSARDEAEALPWSFIETGYEKLIDFKSRKQEAAKVYKPSVMDPLDNEAMQRALRAFELRYQRKQKIRLEISKTGFSKYIPHIDFMEIIKRALRMSGLPVSFTMGFNKKERLAMGFPLPLGYNSISELCDVELYSDIEIQQISAELNKHLPEGIEVKSVSLVEKNEPLMSIIRAVEYIVGVGNSELFDSLLRGLENGKNFIKKKNNKERIISFSEAVYEFRSFKRDSQEFLQRIDAGLELKDLSGAVIIRISAGNENSMRMDDIIQDLTGLSSEELYNFVIIKTAQFRDGEGGMVKVC